MDNVGLKNLLKYQQGNYANMAYANGVEGGLSHVGVLREIVWAVYDTTPIVLFQGSWFLQMKEGM